MSHATKAWMQAAIGLAGLGLGFVWAPAGVTLCLVATALTTQGALDLNAPATRLPQRVALVLHMVTLYLATGAPWLTAAVLATGMTAVPSPWALLHLRRVFRWLPLLGALVAGGLLALAWRSGWWILAVAPLTLPGLLVGPQLIAGQGRFAGLISRVKLRVGEPLPPVTLPLRDGSGEVDLSAQRGQAMLILFVRGDWCPICHVLMRVVSRERNTLQKKGVKLFVVSPAEGELDVELERQVLLETTLLLDRKAATARSWGLLEAEADNEADAGLPLPVALLVDADGVLRDITRPEDVTAYSSESRIARQLRSLPSPA